MRTTVADMVARGGYFRCECRIDRQTLEHCVELMRSIPDAVYPNNWETVESIRSEPEAGFLSLTVNRVQGMIDLAKSLAEANRVLESLSPDFRCEDGFAPLLIASDYHQDMGEEILSWLLRAEYLRRTAGGSEAIRVERGRTVTLNPQRRGKHPNPSMTQVIETTDGDSVVIHTLARDHKADAYSVVSRRFVIGDTVETGAYNLVYFGQVKQITSKTIKTEDRHGERKSFTLSAFAETNWNFDLAESRQRNANWSD